MPLACIFGRKGLGIVVHPGRILVAEAGGAVENPHILHGVSDRQMQADLLDLHRHAQQEDSVKVLQGRGTLFFTQANPFKYRYIHYLKKNTSIYAKENDPMVVMCTPGMLQNGQSRTLL